MLRKEAYASNAVISIILVAGIIITLIGFVSVGIAQGQVNTSSSLTSQQKAAICSPSNPRLKFDKAKNLTDAIFTKEKSEL